MTLMRVKALTHDATMQQSMVVLEGLAGRLGLGFVIPMNEANRLARTLGLTHCPCVPVFELIEQILVHFEARVRRMVLDGSDLGISAMLYIGNEGGETAFPCHPADALALAKRTGAPVYATDDALRHACPLDQPHPPDSCRPDVARWLEQVRPEDFEG